jgi:HSP20 family molecular chaperone IbpA
MRGGEASKEKSHNEAHRPKLVEVAGLADLAESIRHSIAYRAFELYEARGRQGGHDLEDWFRAEAEVLQPVPVEITDSKDQLTVRAQVPNFSAEEVTVGIGPRRVIIWGKKKTPARTAPQQTHQDQFLREQDLPGEIDPTKVVATLQRGVLDITLSRGR